MIFFKSPELLSKPAEINFHDLDLLTIFNKETTSYNHKDLLNVQLCDTIMSDNKKNIHNNVSSYYDNIKTALTTNKIYHMYNKRIIFSLKLYIIEAFFPH